MDPVTERPSWKENMIQSYLRRIESGLLDTGEAFMNLLTRELYPLRRGGVLSEGELRELIDHWTAIYGRLPGGPLPPA